MGGTCDLLQLTGCPQHDRSRPAPIPRESAPVTPTRCTYQSNCSRPGPTTLGERRVGGVKMTNKKLLVKALKKMCTATSVTDPFDGVACCIDEKGNFGFWLEDAMNRKKWEWLIDCQLKRAHLKINPPRESAHGTNNNQNNEPPPPPSPRRSEPPSPPHRTRNNMAVPTLYLMPPSTCLACLEEQQREEQK